MISESLKKRFKQLSGLIKEDVSIGPDRIE